MGGGVGGLLYSKRGSTLKYNLSNGRGDIVAQADSDATLTWTASYEAYGKRTKETGTNLDKQRGNSKDEDPTGLLNEGFRYRDLETGVWLSRDPAGFVDGPNLYAYVKQNPWTAFDPDGLQTSYGDARAKEIITTLRQIAPQFDAIIAEMEESDHLYRFETVSIETADNYSKGKTTPIVRDPTKFSKGGYETAPIREGVDRLNGKGMGALVQFVGQEHKGKAPEATAAHELGHAFDIMRGITPVKPGSKINTVFPHRSIDDEENENRAVRTENIYNEKMRLPLRTIYPNTEGDRKTTDVPNPEGKYAPVNTEPTASQRKAAEEAKQKAANESKEKKP